MFRLYFTVLTLFTCLCLAPLSQAQEADKAELSPIEKLQADIAALPDSGRSAAEQEQFLEVWQQTLAALQQTESLREQQEALQTTLDQAPKNCAGCASSSRPCVRPTRSSCTSVTPAAPCRIWMRPWASRSRACTTGRTN